MERGFFKFIIGTKRFEACLGRIRDQWEGEGILSVPSLKSLLEALRGVHAHGDNLNPSFSVLSGNRSEGVELLHAMDAFLAQVEDHQDRFAGKLR